MNITILSGGSGNDALVKGMIKLFGETKNFNIDVIVNAYDNGKSTGICRAVTNTLGVSDIRKNHSRMYKAVYGDKIDQKLMDFYEKRYNFSKGNELNEIKDLLNEWGLNEYVPVAERFFKQPTANQYDYKDFSVANIIYAQMYSEIGYEKTNKHFCDKLGIRDFVTLNSFDNVFIKALTESGYLIDDEGKTVFWNNPDDKIVKTVYDVADNRYGINKKAVDLVQNADVILISTGTFWSSIQPTVEYLDFFKYINSSKAKKIWMMNNEKDGDSWGVTNLELIKFMEESGLDLSDFKILLNSDANITMKMIDGEHDFVVKSMGNNNGKHDPEKFVRGILETYYGLCCEKFNKILFDFDDTLWGRDAHGDVAAVSKQNIQMINDTLKGHAEIVSGNSYESIYKKLATIYGEDLKGFEIPIWADANTTKYVKNKPIEKLKKLELSDKAVAIIKQIANECGVGELLCSVGVGQPVNMKIKPLENAKRQALAKLFNSKSEGQFKASVTGKTTLDILNPENSKAKVFEHITKNGEKCIFVGDEIKKGNDAEIAKVSTQAIEVKDVFETAILLKLLSGGKQNEIWADNLCGETIKI